MTIELMALPRADWRVTCIEEGLRAFLSDNGALRATLKAIRQEQPELATLTVWDGPERRQLLEFLALQPDGYRSLLRGTASTLNHGERFALLGWYETRWHGEQIEIVFAPTGTKHGYLIALGSDATILHDCLAAIEAYTNRPRGRCLRYSFGWQNAPELEAEVDGTAWSDIVLPADKLTSIQQAVEGFFSHRDAFTALGFGWRRGILLVGPPGTGKTLVCKAAARSVPGVPFLYVRDFHEGRGEAVKTIFERARKVAPCILAFEDIDGLVGLGNRTVFLNELDGFERNDGVLIIASSNHPGQIDEALLKRPSRFDRVYHIGLPGWDERREFTRRILARPQLAALHDSALDRDELAMEVATRTDGFTLAYLKEVFTGAALQRAESGAMVLDSAFAVAVFAQIEDLGRHLRQASNPDRFGAWRESGGAGDTRLGFYPVRKLPGR